MKELIVVVGLIVLGAIIVSIFVLGDGNSLQSAADNVLSQGNDAVRNIKIVP